MDDYAWPGIVSALALLTYYFTLFRSGMARLKFNVPAPSHEGPEGYLRHVRAHQNTLEHLVLFLPGLWLFAFAVSPLWAAGIGMLWPIGRVAYALGYYRSAGARLPGLYLSMPPIYVFVIGSLLGFVWQLV
jgi:glutathione S-transferase